MKAQKVKCLLRLFKEKPARKPSRHDGLLHCPIIKSSYDSCTTANSIALAYAISWGNVFRLMSICKPSVSRIVSRVLSCGLPSPRSMATSVLSPTPAKSESVCWFTPKCFQRSLMIFPIPLAFIFTINCDFAAKVRKRNLMTRQIHNKLWFRALNAMMLVC